MFKPVHAADGVLSQAINNTSTSLYVDDKMFCVLEKALADGSYTYLIIQENFTYEIVKVSGVAGTSLVIQRAQDSTIASSFSIGAETRFVMSKAAITDIINDESLGEIALTGGGMVTVTKIGTNSYSISAPKFTITSDSAKILVGGEFPNFVLSTPLVMDCCD